jgi:RimJ/RimL family protein N-acetyltransferase
MEIKFVPFNRIFLDASFEWLQDKDLRDLIDAPTLTKESQELWFQGLGKRNDYHIWGVTANELPVGVCGLKCVKNGKGEYWGYIGVRDYWGNGIGTMMLYFIEAFAMSIELNILELRVLKVNQRAFGIYLRNGFFVSEQLEDTTFMIKKLGDD